MLPNDILKPFVLLLTMSKKKLITEVFLFYIIWHKQKQFPGVSTIRRGLLKLMPYWRQENQIHM
jgi:hypothetical protein